MALVANPNAVHLLEENPDKVDWISLSANPNAGHMLEQNLDKVDWEVLSGNPCIFGYDYDAIKRTFYESGIAEGIMADRFHPKNMAKWEEWGFDDW
jgi:hypothetical protein